MFGVSVSSATFGGETAGEEIFSALVEPREEELVFELELLSGLKRRAAA